METWDQTDTVMQAVGADFHRRLQRIAKEAALEVTRKSRVLGLTSDQQSQALGMMVAAFTLPLPSKNQVALDIMMSLLIRTRNLPVRIQKISEEDVDLEPMVIGMANWARQVLLPALLETYQSVLDKYAPRIPQATQGRIKAHQAFDFLRKSFRQVLTVNSSWFEDGELLRRVVRTLPI